MLQARGLQPTLRLYLEQQPSVDELRDLLARLAIPARQLLRQGEALYRELQLDDPTRNEDALLAAMATHPRLIERPILVAGTRAVIGRPPERALSIL